MCKSLYESLFALYETVKAHVNQSKERGDLTVVPYERINARDLDFSMGHTDFVYDWDNIEYFDVYKWPNAKFTQSLEALKTLPEVDNAFNLICKKYHIADERNQMTRALFIHAFLSPLLNNLPNDLINDTNVHSYLETFINDYEISSSDELYTWDINIWLSSFELEGNEVVFNDGTLRRPVASELGLVRQRSAHIEEVDKMLGNSIDTTIMLQFSMTSKKNMSGGAAEDIKHEIEARLDVLRLFKPANIYVFHQTANPRSVLEYKHTETPSPPFDQSYLNKVGYQDTSNYKCWVQEGEYDSLILFYNRIKPILRSISQKNYFSGSHLDLAVHRYKDALLRSKVNAHRLVSAISCLEALLSNQGSEITYKMSIHLSGLLRHFDFETISVYNKIREAYGVRSTILHGSKLSDEQIHFTNKHTHEIVNYARICLLVCLQLQKLKSKNELIKLIDYSLVSSAEFLELNKVINEHVFIPVVYPYRSMETGDSFMNKRIACIGWGSLIWKPEKLKFVGDWHSNGPVLPIEFTRISNNQRVTLILDKKAKPVQTLYRFMETENLEEAVLALKERENGGEIEMVTATEPCDGSIKKTISDWLRLNNIDAAIWTAIGYGKGKVRPSIEQILEHLKSLQGQPLVDAEEYIRKAPKQIKTDYRQKIEDALGWTPLE
jgi:Apea-like HEPN